MALAPDPDQVLMAQVQEGDDRAFETLVHKYQGMVLALARRYLGSRYQALDDVAQQVFLRMYRARMRYEPRAKVKTWLYSITVNACLNEIRKLQSGKHRAVNAFTAVFGDDEDGGAPSFEDARADAPSGGMESTEVRARVEGAVDALPAQQRLALVLTRYHGASYQDVAATMETTVPAVKSLLTRARENLRHALADLVDVAPGAFAPRGGSS